MPRVLTITTVQSADLVHLTKLREVGALWGAVLLHSPLVKEVTVGLARRDGVLRGVDIGVSEIVTVGEVGDEAVVEVEAVGVVEVAVVEVAVIVVEVGEIVP